MTSTERRPTTRVVRTRAELGDALADVPRPLGLVPTMGWLHAGHRSLMQRARADNATTIATIFVNPRQFNEAADYLRYPRNEARDLAICEEEGIDLVFAPDVDEVYPPGFDTVVSVGAVARPLEGAARPGHFDGVATVVLKLFNRLRPDIAYFGQKDAQQLAVIRRMTADLDLGVEIRAVETVREPDGLAIASRNAYLSPEERRRASSLHRALVARDPGLVEGDVDYLAVVDADTFLEVEPRPGALVIGAARFGSTRLIDTIRIEDR